MTKILILGDSASNPRGFGSVDDITHLEDTYPYQLRAKHKDAVFYQISFGNITTEELCSQATAYLIHWIPDIIIVHSGLNDCRPEPLTQFHKDLLNFLSFGLINRFSITKKLIYHPKVINKRQISRVSKKKFRKTLKRFKLNFSKSKIYWLEIGTNIDYETLRPGFHQKAIEYNELIHEIYKDDMVLVIDAIKKVNGFNVDNLHWRISAHKVVSDILVSRIATDFNDKGLMNE